MVAVGARRSKKREARRIYDACVQHIWLADE